MNVILLMVMTMDGKIARSSTELVDWTGKEDKKYFVQITKDAGAMIMGSKTFDTIGSPLPDRKNIVLTRNKNRKSLDDNLIFTDNSPEKILEDLEKKGFKKVALIGGSVINSLFAKENLINEIHVTVAPILFGKGLSMFDTTLNLKLEFMETRKIDKGYVLLKYRVIQ
ncbi:MAG: dihydrofolate reductase [Desulfobacteraceae bacterium]|nr:dihydrofolate reductase [Desulfobacteraceae bacterium]